MSISLKSSNTIKIIYNLFLIAVFSIPQFIPKKEKVTPPKLNLERAITLKDTIQNQFSTPIIKHYSQSEIINSIQQSRESIGLSLLTNDKKTCQDSKSLFQISIDKQELTLEDLQVFCPYCDQKAYITTEGNYKIENQDSWMETEDIASLTNGVFTHICVYSQKENALVVLGNIPKTSAEPISNQQEASSKDFTREQLWQALVDYRHAHQKSDLQQSDSLCNYAQERVEEHITLFENKSKEEYLSQDKYPLDAHDGFAKDGESGYLFEATGFNLVAENLAYWPTAEFPNQVIEWGWDTSTEGHREAQLSEDYSHACIMGRQGFYVAIFAKN